MRIRSLVSWANMRPRCSRPWNISLAGILLLGWSGIASAAPITATYLTNTTFTSGPNPTISSLLTVTFDPTISGALTVLSFSSAVLDADFPVTGYITSGIVSEEIVFGNDCSSLGCVVAAPLQFFEVFEVYANGAVDPDDQGGLRYGDANFMSSRYGPEFTTGFYGSPLQTVTEIATTVPEPVTLALVGPLTAVLALKRRRRAVRSA